LLGLSANDVASHHEWIKDVDEISGSSLSVSPHGASTGLHDLSKRPADIYHIQPQFPIIGDKERKVATTYDMLDALDASNVDALGLPLTVRSVFIIDPKKVIRLIISYPASTGRNVDELLRVIDSLQVSAKYKVATPVDWVPGQDVIVANSVKKEEADQLFPGYKSVKVRQGSRPYLRVQRHVEKRKLIVPPRFVGPCSLT
jgi:alkyl hydroperoxide reductase subunit AhpC